MNLSQIEAFVDLVETRSFSHTAQRLSVSQPAISQRINALEKSLGCQLFERKSDDLVLTHIGTYLYEQGKGILALCQSTYLHIQDMKSSPHGSVSIGASTIPSQFLISPMIKEFRNSYPHIQIQVHVAGTEQITRLLSEKKVDVAIVGSYPSDDSSFHVFPVATDQLQLIVPIDHAWATRAYINIEELKDAILILREKQSGTRKILSEALSHHNIQLDKLSVLGEFGSTDAVISAVENSLGVSFVSTAAAERAITLQKVKPVLVRGLSIERKLYCAVNKDHNSLSTNKFVDFIQTLAL
ncbi:hypothetical protein BHU72_07025 [Desulfuribacillus stibiiarsenatis]|uniref:HTH lysR-type domain-containing protein n=1 Tax=Desulfuribacillus stibiiarsenatis TaxID=1390249 RepID=A0A1E5L494_9FIRM|nr:hypothetical protein BHU72_07025 [Desulfuribacillus stibiiarsenatis]